MLADTVEVAKWCEAEGADAIHVSTGSLFPHPLNPPGALRKVGPSLFRVSEKTNQQWARKWIAAPRNFRPTTKMPHFYGLSNNTREVLPDDQKDFPDTEVASIAYYIFRESSDYLHGKDTYSRFMEQRINDLQDRQNKKIASEQEQRQLEELLRLRDLERKPKLLTEQIIDGQGNTVQLPTARTGDAAKAQLKSGRQLFTERGCLGCHSHAGTTKADDTQVPSVKSDADFAPDLSRLAAKIAPEENPSDPNAKRRWVVQWVLDPKIHHPRTRMPVTHLTVEQADDVAAWLLSQPVSDWSQENIPEPKPEALVDLARVYLLKAPGMTREEADDILSGEPNRRKGIADVSNLPLDSDERQLASGQGGLTDDKIKWYVGRKAILRQGCFGCHDIPGFEAAKPIGT